MMGACGADDDVGVLLRQKFKKQRFQMIDDTQRVLFGHFFFKIAKYDVQAIIDVDDLSRSPLRTSGILDEHSLSVFTHMGIRLTHRDTTGCGLALRD